MIQVKTFAQKFDWRNLKTISTSEQINQFIVSNPDIKVIEIQPWNSYHIAVIYDVPVSEVKEEYDNT